MLALCGLLLMLGAARRWQWLYPGHTSVRGCGEPAKRILLFLIGLTLVVAGVVFYLFREHMSYQ